MACRMDKFVWAVRLAKTRTQATEAISKGKVKLNDTAVKPARDVKIGDEIQVIRHTAIYSYKIIALLDRRVGAKLVEQYIVDTTTDEEREKYRLYQLAQSAYRAHGTGKPTKKDRRDLDDFFDNWED